MQRVPLLAIDDLGLRQLPKTAAEKLLELVMRRYERTSTVFTSNRAVDEWGKLLGDTTATSALFDRLLYHAHVVQCGPKSYRILRKERPQISRCCSSRWSIGSTSRGEAPCMLKPSCR